MRHRWQTRGVTSSADRQRAYRARRGARTGERGRPVVAPCGTPAAYKRHKRKGEPIDEACRLAYNADQREFYRRRLDGRRDQRGWFT